MNYQRVTTARGAYAPLEVGYIDREARAELWEALEPSLLAVMGAGTSSSIPFLESIAFMGVSVLQVVIASLDWPGNREYDDRTVAYELKHEALRRLVRERREEGGK